MNPAIETPLLVPPTQLGPPRVPRDAIRRARLNDRLQEGLARPLTLVCAPAGFGKSTLLVSALTDTPWPVAWLTLREGDGRFASFVHGLVASLRREFDDTCQTTLSLLRLPEIPSPAVVAGALQTDFAELSDSFVLVVEDYHLIEDPDVHALMVALLRRPSDQLHLVVTSRRVPPWPLARLRAAEQLTQIGVADLRFADDEARQLLQRAARVPVPEDVAAAIQRHMGGWAAGLRLAAIVVRESADSGASLKALEGRTSSYVMEYLLDEVVAEQHVEMRQFLRQTSILERISAPVADALVDPTGSRLNSIQALEWLQQMGLLVSAIDDQRGWYQYHDLLRDALRRDLQMHESADFIRGLHLKASNWHEAQGYVEAAMHHALAADDLDRAAAIVETHTDAVLDREEWHRLEHWLGLLPAELVERRPGLLIARAWTLHFSFHHRPIAGVLDAAAELLERETPTLPEHQVEELRAQIDVVRATISGNQGDAQRGVEHAQRAWNRLPARRSHALGRAGEFLVIRLQEIGEPAAAEAVLSSARAAELERMPAGAIRLQMGLAAAQLSAGDLHRLELTARSFLDAARRRGLELAAAWGYYTLGRVYYEWNRLDAAAEQYAAVVDLRASAHLHALRTSLQGLALIGQARGIDPSSSDAFQELLELGKAAPSVEPEANRSFEARLALMGGDVEAATYWLRTAGPLPAFRRALSVEVPRFTRARVLLAQGTDDTFHEAASLLADQLELYEARHQTLRVVEILALQALVCQARGEIDAALKALERAVTLAQPGGFIRTFVDLGPAPARLLPELGRRVAAGDYVGRLIEALTAFSHGFAPAVPARERKDLELIEPLTNRELDVLSLLDGRLTNKEIAGTLHISWQTVSRHAANIYQKLQVPGRRAAVQRARSLGLLSSADT